MGKFKYCLMNKPDGGNGDGKCYVGHIRPIHVERSAYLQELKRLKILPDYFECTGFECKHPTIPKKLKSLYAWEKRTWAHLQD